MHLLRLSTQLDGRNAIFGVTDVFPVLRGGGDIIVRCKMILRLLTRESEALHLEMLQL